MPFKANSDLGSQDRPISLSPSPPPGPSHFSQPVNEKMGNAPSSVTNGIGSTASPKIPETKPVIVSPKVTKTKAASPAKAVVQKSNVVPAKRTSTTPAMSTFPIPPAPKLQKPQTKVSAPSSNPFLATLARNPFRVNGEKEQQQDEPSQLSPGPQKNTLALSSPLPAPSTLPANSPPSITPVAVMVSAPSAPMIPAPPAPAPHPALVENPLAVNEQLLSIYKSLNPKQQEVNLAALIALTNNVTVRDDAMRMFNPLEDRMEVDYVAGTPQTSPTESKSKFKSIQELIEEKLAILQTLRQERIRTNTLKRHSSEKQEIEICKVANFHKTSVTTTTTISYFVEWENGKSEWVTADDFASPKEARMIFDKYRPLAAERRESVGSTISESPMPKGITARGEHRVKRPRGRPRKSTSADDGSIGGKYVSAAPGS